MDSEWLNEFGEEYRPHDCVLELMRDPLVTDESWHNDVAPHFTAKAGDGQLVELWFYRADASNRADIGDGISNDDTQYHLYLVSDDAFREVAPEDLHTDDAALAVKTFIVLMEVDMQALADDAYPEDDADDGSERQTDAANRFFYFFHAKYPHFNTDEFTQWCSHATTDEMLDEAMRRVNAETRHTEEVMIYTAHVRKWEFAHKDGLMWTRRDGSTICEVGKELATLPVPPKPKL